MSFVPVLRSIAVVGIVLGYPAGVFFWAYHLGSERLILALVALIVTSSAYSCLSLIRRRVARGALGKGGGIVFFCGCLVIIIVGSVVATLLIDKLLGTFFGATSGMVGIIYSAALLMNVCVLGFIGIVGSVAIFFDASRLR